MNEMPRWIEGPFDDCTKPKTSDMRWETYEIASIRRMWSQGFNISEIVTATNRGRAAVLNRLHSMDLTEETRARNAHMVASGKAVNRWSWEKLKARAPLSVNADEIERRISNTAFLMSLLRAGHKPGQAELHITPDGRINAAPTSYAMPMSYVGSSSAMCCG